MITVIKKSSFKSFLGSLCIAIFIFALAVLFICVPYLELFSDAGTFFSILFPILGVAGCLIGISQLKSSLAFLKADGGWRVEINDEVLKWDSPLEELQKSFEIMLTDIEYIESVSVYEADYATEDDIGTGHTTRYVIHMHTGAPIHLKEDISGIWPHRVFKDLEKRGIEYVKTIKRL